MRIETFTNPDGTTAEAMTADGRTVIRYRGVLGLCCVSEEQPEEGALDELAYLGFVPTGRETVTGVVVGIIPGRGVNLLIPGLFGVNQESGYGFAGHGLWAARAGDWCLTDGVRVMSSAEATDAVHRERGDREARGIGCHDTGCWCREVAP